MLENGNEVIGNARIGDAVGNHGISIMDKTNFDKYLKDRYEGQINWYETKSAKNKKYYTFFQWGVIVLSAILPVLVVLLTHELKWVTATIAAILAIGTAGLKTFKFQENWVNYRTIAETLKKERYFYEAELDDYKDTSDKESLFVERVESLISREHSLWFTKHVEKEEEKEKKAKQATRFSERRY